MLADGLYMSLHVEGYFCACLCVHMDMEMDNHSQGGGGGGGGGCKFHLPPLCVVCSSLDSSDNELLTEFVVTQAKNNSLTSTVVETTNFFATIEAKNIARGGKNVQPSRGVGAICANDIEQHILYCVATRIQSVGRLVCNTIVMKSVLTAETHAQVLSAAKLLLQTQSTEKNATP